jgi:hypothetical protein
LQRAAIEDREFSAALAFGTGKLFASFDHISFSIAGSANHFLLLSIYIACHRQAIKLGPSIFKLESCDRRLGSLPVPRAVTPPADLKTTVFEKINTMVSGFLDNSLQQVLFQVGRQNN